MRRLLVGPGGLEPAPYAPPAALVVAPPQIENNREIFVFISKLLYDPLRFVNFYLVRFWSPRRSGVTLATTHKAGFFDPGGRHLHIASQYAR